MLWQNNSLAYLQEAVEEFLIEILIDAYILATHGHRVTVMHKDLIVLRRLRYRFIKLL